MIGLFAFTDDGNADWKMTDQIARSINNRAGLEIPRLVLSLFQPGYYGSSFSGHAFSVDFG